MAHRSIVLIGQSDFNSAGRSKCLSENILNLLNRL